MWKVNFTTWTVFTLGQETSIGTIWPGSDLVVSRDSETWGYFSKAPPPPLPPPPRPLKLPKNVFHVRSLHFTTCSWCLSLNSRLIAPESREVKLNLSKWEPAVSKEHQHRDREIYPQLLFGDLKDPFIILKRGEALSFREKSLGCGIGRPRFYFQLCCWQVCVDLDKLFNLSGPQVARL